MGKLYIITENQKNIFENLLGSEESVFVKNSNPFNKGFTNINQFKIYNPKMSNGELFYKIVPDKIKNYVVPKLKSALTNKSFRFIDSNGEDGIFKFTPNMKFNIGIPVDYKNFFSNGVIPKFLPRVTIESDVFNRFSYIPSMGITEVSNGTISQETKNGILKIINPIILLSSLPEDCFELRKVQRQPTDF